MPPTMLPILAELRNHKRWITWRAHTTASGRRTKKPDCSTQNPLAWRTWDEVADTPRTADGGVGFVLTGGVRDEDTGALLVGLDLDSCVHDDGTISPWALEAIAYANAGFVERSPSGHGLRGWVWVMSPPLCARTRVQIDAPPAVAGKQPEIQLFGLGAAQYVTITGDMLPGYGGSTGHIGNIDELIERYGFDRTPDAPEKRPLPVGEGLIPSLVEIDHAVRQMQHGTDLVEGRWHNAVKAESSASEAFALLEHYVLIAARNHGEQALTYLLTHTAWGQGSIEDSLDPVRYSNERWVRRDLARVAQRMPAPSADVFPLIETPQSSPVAADSLLYTLPELIRDRRGQQFLVHRVIPRPGIVQVFGAPACGKTPLVLSLAMAIATGQPTWFGHDVDCSGPVVYMVGEDLGGVTDRIAAELQVRNIEAADVPIFVTKRPGRLCDAADVATWLREIEARATGVRLLVVDTQHANMGSGDENSNTDIGVMLQHLRVLATRLGCCVVLVHHPGHGDAGRGRGASALPGGLDGELEVRRDGQTVTAVPGKCKNWEAQPPLLGSLQVVTLGNDDKGRPITAVRLDDTPPDGTEPFADPIDVVLKDKAAQQVLRAVASNQGAPLSETHLATASKLSTKVARNGLLKLIDLEIIKTADKGRGRRAASYVLTEKGDATLMVL